MTKRFQFDDKFCDSLTALRVITDLKDDGAVLKRAVALYLTCVKLQSSGHDIVAHNLTTDTFRKINR